MLTLIFSTFFWEKWLEITKRLKDVPTPNSQNLIKIYGVVNMKQLKIKKISIENFAGLKNQVFEFNGNDARVYGVNDTGKTTTATALQWLLFDIGLDGSTKSFAPVPLDENNKEEYELTRTVSVH